MAKDIEARGGTGETIARAKETLEKSVEKTRDFIDEGMIPEQVRDYVTEYPLVALGGAAFLGFLVARLPIIPRGFLRATLGTFGGKLLGERLAFYASESLKA